MLIIFVALLAIYVERKLIKPLVILDMNGVLMYREHKSTNINPPDKKQGNHSIWKRKGLDEFFDQLFFKAHVGVWSSMVEYNTKQNVEFVFGDTYKKKLLFIRNQEHCVKEIEKGFYPDNPDRPLFTKTIPWYFYLIFPTIYIVDDDIYKLTRNPARSIIHVKTWKVGENDNEELNNILNKL